MDVTEKLVCVQNNKKSFATYKLHRTNNIKQAITIAYSQFSTFRVVVIIRKIIQKLFDIIAK